MARSTSGGPGVGPQEKIEPLRVLCPSRDALYSNLQYTIIVELCNSIHSNKISNFESLEDSLNFLLFSFLEEWNRWKY